MHPADAAKGADTLRALTRALATQGIKFDDTADGQSALIQGFAARWRAVGDDPRDRHRRGGRRRRQGLDRRQREVQARARRGRRRRRLQDARPRLHRRAQPDQRRDARSARFNDASNKEALDNLKHVGGVLFWTGRDGDTVTSDLFVEST